MLGTRLAERAEPGPGRTAPTRRYGAAGLQGEARPGSLRRGRGEGERNRRAELGRRWAEALRLHVRAFKPHGAMVLQRQKDDISPCGPFPAP